MKIRLAKQTVKVRLFLINSSREIGEEWRELKSAMCEISLPGIRLLGTD